MCGIVSYRGKKQEAGEIVYQGLLKLEYRGYDSWGVFVDHDPPFIYKKIGKISDSKAPTWPQSQIAIGHTRWATHGGISEINAHPHLSAKQKVIVVHNGVMENYLEIKNSLLKEGCKFRSETDTEVVANLIESHLDAGKDFLHACMKSWTQIEGRNAVVAMDMQTKEI